MKYAISTDSGKVSGHFGRAPEFTFITIENEEIINKEVKKNPGHTVGSIPQFVSEQGADCMVAGGMGRRAIQFFEQYGINIIMGVSGKIKDVVEDLRNGTLESGESTCKPGGGKGYGVEKIHTEEDDKHPHEH